MSAGYLSCNYNYQNNQSSSHLPHSISSKSVKVSSPRHTKIIKHHLATPLQSEFCLRMQYLPELSYRLYRQSFVGFLNLVAFYAPSSILNPIYRFWSIPQEYIIIMATVQALSQRFLQELYQSKANSQSQPVLQILAFETSEQNPKQINIRLSDGVTFIDATLSGPYQISNGKITVSPFTAYHGNCLEFKRFDVVRVMDYFSKIDPAKICRLKMMIRKITEMHSYDRKINRPQELAFYIQFNGLQKDDGGVAGHPNSRMDIEEQLFCRPHDEHEAEDPNKKQRISMINRELQILGITKDRNPDEPLTCREVMNGFDGFFIGRLMRLKQTMKEGKDNSAGLPMLTLGFVDSVGDILRLNLLGKLALREQKELKRGKCYYIKGLQVVNTKNSCYVKLRQKDYKLHLLNDQQVSNRFPQEYYHWQHEYDYIENENVDIIGVIEDIQEKTCYGYKAVGDSTQSKQVIRVVIRNKFKTVKVSFWSDQLKNLSKLNLKPGQVVIFEDVKKKKVVFLDFSIESTVARLSPGSQYNHKLSHLLPEHHDYAEPINVAQLYKIQQLDKYSTKIHTINAYLARIHEQKVIFKMCQLCKKKINLHSQKCFECKASVMSYKYNTLVEFSDYSGSVMLHVYDSVAQKLLSIPALRFKELKENVEQFEKFIDGVTYRPFSVGVQIKSERFILRAVEELRGSGMTEWCKETVGNISKFRESTQQKQ